MLATKAKSARPTIKLDLADTPDEAVGQTLGSYKLLERVGEDGCSEVYVAEQTQPLRRRVALKVIKLGMDNAITTGTTIAACRHALGCPYGHPQEYLTDVLGRLPAMKNHQVIDVLPSRWKPSPPRPA